MLAIKSGKHYYYEMNRPRTRYHTRNGRRAPQRHPNPHLPHKPLFAEVGSGLGKVPFESYISLYGGRDRQINVSDMGDAAFSLRDSLWVSQV